MAALRVFSCFYPEIIGGAGLLGFLLPGFFGGLRSGHIDNDFRDFVAGLGNTAEEEVANISHDSGAARGNAVLGDQDEEAREHVVRQRRPEGKECWQRVGSARGFLKTLDLADCSFIFSSPMRVCWVCHPGCFRKSGKQRTCGSMSA